MKSCLGLMSLIVLSAVFTDTGLQCEAITVISHVIVALINESTYFNCSTMSERAEWLFSSDENLHQAIIYSYGKVKPLFQDRFQVEKYANDTEKQFNLIIGSVTKDDAGRYICRNPDSQNKPEEDQAQLTVIDTEPVCDSNLNADGPTGPTSCAAKPEMVQLSCSVRYSGKQAPELQWIMTDKGIIVDPSRVECSDVGNRYTCNLWIKSNGSSYVCQTKESRTKRYRCTSDILGIIQALGASTELVGSLHDKIYCSVNSSSQSCTYSWNFDNGISSRTESHDQVIELKRSGRFVCEANCPIRNTNCTFTAMAVNVEHVSPVLADDGKMNLGIILPIVIVVAVAAIICSIVIFIMWKKEKQNSSRSVDQDANHALLEQTNTYDDKRVRGLTILQSELFVTWEMSSIVYVFSINSLTSSRALDTSSNFTVVPITRRKSSRTLKVDELMDPGTIVACIKNTCLYIMDQRKNNEEIKKIFRIKPDGTVLNMYDTDDGDRGRISVNRDGDIVMTVYDKHQLKVYRPTLTPDGNLGTELIINFCESETSLTYIFHAINSSSGNFVMSHGVDSKQSKLHRVCVTNAAGQVLRSFGNEKGSGDAALNSPAYLVERKDGSILVADRKNDRIIKLNSKLEFETVLFAKEKDDVSRPEAMCIYDGTEPPILFLGCNKTKNSGGYLMVLTLDQKRD